MSDSDIQRALDVLAESRRVALPLAELAQRVGTLDPDGLATRLAADPRLVVIQRPGLPTPALLSGPRETAYSRALQAAGLLGDRHVALADTTREPAGDDRPATRLRVLLQRSAAQLVAGSGASTVAAAAERAGRAVEEALNANA